MITLTALSGVRDDGGASAHLLQIDDHVRILLSAGWDDSFEPATLPPALGKMARSLDLVLLTHPTIDHVGALPTIVRHLNPTVAVYATLPVKILGRLACLEVVASKRQECGYGMKREARELQQQIQAMSQTEQTNVIDPELAQGEPSKTAVGSATSHGECTADDVEAAFDQIHVVRYSQPTALAGKMSGIIITAFNAGHTLGGTIWKVERDGESVVYANGINHMRERHLDGTDLLRSEALGRPDILIADGGNAMLELPKRKARDAAFVGVITANVLGDADSKAGSVLIPVDASARVLEHALLLDQHWSFARLSAQAHLVLLSHTSDLLLQEVRSMTEWMGRDISSQSLPGSHQADGTLNFELKHFKLCRTIEDVQRLAQNDLKTGTTVKPMVILTPSDSLTNGFARTLFAELCSIPETLLVLPGRGQSHSFSRQLWTLWQERGGPQLGSKGVGKGARDDVGGPVILNDTRTLLMSRAVPLEGEELRAYEKHQIFMRQQEEIQEALIQQGRALLEREESDESDSESEGDHFGDGNGVRGGQRGLASASHANEMLGGKGMAHCPYDIFPSHQARSGAQSQQFFKQSSSTGSRHLVFPDPPSLTRGFLAYERDYSLRGNDKSFPRLKARKTDVYGEWPDLERWERAARGAADLEAASKMDTVNDGVDDVPEKKEAASTQEAAAKPSDEVKPFKYVSKNRDVEIKCRLFCVNLEGLNDGKAIKTILPQVNPRKLVIVHASTEATEHLLETFKAIPAMTTQIFAPEVNEAISIGEETHSWQLQLGESVVRSLKFSKFLDYDLAAVNGFVHCASEVAKASDEDDDLGLDHEERTTKPTAMPTLELTFSTASSDGSDGAEDVVHDRPATTTEPPRLASKHRLPLLHPTLSSSLFIGDIKLTELRVHLKAIGISSEFVGGGVLLCGSSSAATKAGKHVPSSGLVAIRKRGRGRLVLEGNVGEELYQIRQIIYAQVAEVTIG